MMKIQSRYIALGGGWLLTMIAGVLIGRQMISGLSEQETGTALFRTRGGTPGLAGREDRSSEATKLTRSALSSVSPSRSLENLKEDLHRTLSQADRVSRTRDLLRLIDSLEPGEFRDVVDAFRADGLSGVRGADYALLIHAWVGADPYAAVTYLAETEPSGEARENAITAWAALDPQAAAAWVEGREDGGDTNNWTVGLLRGIASIDPEMARQTLESLEAGRTRSSSMEAVLPYVMQQGFDYTAAWIASLQDEDLMRGTARQVARDLTRLDPEQAGTWINEMSSVAARRDASEEVSDEWARRDLESARLWAESLPEDTRTEAAEGVARQMARQDPARTAAWLDSLGNNPDLDGARRIFLDEATRQNPQVALENVYTLSRQEDQARMYQDILGRWAREDNDSARSWVLDHASTLPENLVKRFAKPQN